MPRDSKYSGRACHGSLLGAPACLPALAAVADEASESAMPLLPLPGGGGGGEKHGKLPVVDSPFFSAIVLLKNQIHFPRVLVVF